MDRVIPKDVLDLIYKESHLDKIKRLNAEYHELFQAVNTLQYNVYIVNRISKFGFCYRELDDFHYISVSTFRNNKLVYVANLPKRYFYSSGNNELKWIE